MRLVLALGLVVLAVAPARADRIPFVTLGGTLDFRFSGHTWNAANDNNDPDVLGGGRLTLSFEDRPLPLQPRGVVRGELRLVPELMAGAFAGSQLGEAYAGAGLRGEVALSCQRIRASLYLAGRGLVMGEHRDGVGEAAWGMSLTLRSGTRIGIEEAVDVRPRDHVGNRELDVGATLFVGWAL